MKTRTKGLIIGFILVFAMLIGVFTMMTMTASAAGDSNSAVFEEMVKATDLKIFIGDGDIIDDDGKVLKTEGAGWRIEASSSKTLDIYLDNYVSNRYITVNAYDMDDSEAITVQVYVKGVCRTAGIHVNLSSENTYISGKNRALTIKTMDENSSLEVRSIWGAQMVKISMVARIIPISA